MEPEKTYRGPSPSPEEVKKRTIEFYRTQIKNLIALLDDTDDRELIWNNLRGELFELTGAIAISASKVGVRS